MHGGVKKNYSKISNCRNSEGILYLLAWVCDFFLNYCDLCLGLVILQKKIFDNIARDDYFLYTTGVKLAPTQQYPYIFQTELLHECYFNMYEIVHCKNTSLKEAYHKNI